VRQDAAAFAARMEERGVLSRSLAPWGAVTAGRVTVGSAEHNLTFLQACEEVLES
jgi:histidinol-phosphate/aromatic aminotransferase/cobyric acid decarboxylase-like protein